MLETLDLTRSIDKTTYKSEMKVLNRELRKLQHQCWSANLPVVIVLEGWAAAGKGALIERMTRSLDPRGFEVHPIWPADEEEQCYPFLWRFWRRLPHRGSFGIFYHSWYTRLLEDRIFDRVEENQIPRDIDHINNFERLLVDDGYVVLKFWLHLSKKELKGRLKAYGEREEQAWRVRDEDWAQAKNYKNYRRLAEEMVVRTSSGVAPWLLVEADDRYWCRLKVMRTMVSALKGALERRLKAAPADHRIALPVTEAMPSDFLAGVDLSQTLSPEHYKERLGKAQVKLLRFQRKIFKNKVPVLVLFEGWDAAGKGGAIKRLTAVLDPRSYKVHTFAKPSEEALAHPYLWRFWRRIPPAGTIGIFDRSWYGRVLVERVEGLAGDWEWQRAYREINEFETQLVDAGVVLVKIWLHIDGDEQLNRFEARKNNEYKSYKLTDEDWRNREKWDSYYLAVNQMIQRTTTVRTPWTLVAGNDKLHARVKVIETLTDALEVGLARHCRR
ncbi:polyphosphate:AMP phosphotransferase [Acanthopleuribacter pedis]|uniref:Polyphosphate:AMP phosphotransferase n=1 Tax=Acanthopleuribacter pedis TaxID=442870 RepID=A0A8J7QLC0_9BACT|nr:polyphosphate:AMP phosphotransferase [Acanthopleuribacter pedis]MBO1320080.1 polyphosphate:AMP phosphotransferase [Acanthopleuribacter pedis]